MLRPIIVINDDEIKLSDAIMDLKKLKIWIHILLEPITIDTIKYFLINIYDLRISKVAMDHSTNLRGL